MPHYDFSRWPQPMRDAVLSLLDTLVQVYQLPPVEAIQGNRPPAESSSRFPRSATPNTSPRRDEERYPWPGRTKPEANPVWDQWRGPRRGGLDARPHASRGNRDEHIDFPTLLFVRQAP
jgi:hypothetical protein